jgi:hypothetical protein
MKREDFRRFCDDYNVVLCVLSRDRADVLARYTDKLASEYLLFYSGEGYDEHEYRCFDRIEVPRNIVRRHFVANHVLRQLDERVVILIPDDIKQIHWLGEDRLQHIDSSGFLVMLTNLVVNALDANVGLFGITENDIRKTSPLAPFHLRAMVTGVVGINRTPGALWYDERQKMKADYDFALQHLKRDRLVLKDCRYFLFQDRNTLPGGQMPFRTAQGEEQAVANLKRWWGEDIINWSVGKTTKRLGIRV